MRLLSPEFGRKAEISTMLRQFRVPRCPDDKIYRTVSFKEMLPESVVWYRWIDVVAGHRHYCTNRLFRSHEKLGERNSRYTVRSAVNLIVNLVA